MFPTAALFAHTKLTVLTFACAVIFMRVIAECNVPTDVSAPMMLPGQEI